MKDIVWKSCDFKTHIETKTHWLDECWIKGVVRFSIFVTIEEPTLVKFKFHDTNEIIILNLVEELKV
jgi:hypothetical protein